VSQDTDFLRRWSRLKREAAVSSKKSPENPGKDEKKEGDSPAQLPSVDSLSFDSDFKAFMHSKVEEGVKRAALKKLFADPRFNVMDGLDTYIDDYTKAEPVSEEMLATLDHARQTLFGPPQEEKQAEEKQKQAEEKDKQTAKTDVDPAQDPKAL
jgi:hypothetical protein